MQTMTQPIVVEVFTQDVIRVPGSAAADGKREKLRQQQLAVRKQNREFARQRGFNVADVKRDAFGRVVETPKPVAKATSPPSRTAAQTKAAPRPARQPTTPLASAPKATKRQLAAKPVRCAEYSDEMYRQDCADLLRLVRLL